MSYSITYEKFAFAFNPIRIWLYASAPGTYKLTSGDFGIETQTNESNKSYDGKYIISFELSSIAQSLFDRSKFYQIHEKDTILFKMVDFEINDSSGEIKIGSIYVIWGALQIGEAYTQNKTLTYFRGFPFTVPLFLEERAVIKINGIETSQAFEAGKYNLSISNDATIEVFDEFYRKIFGSAFDSTFGPQRILIANGISIKVNIIDCPNEGIYLRWINKYGEWCYYLFRSSVESNQVEDIDISYDNIYYTTDFTNNYHIGISKPVGKSINQTLKLFAPLVDSDTFVHLLSLVESPVVDMLHSYDNNIPNWVSVNIQPGTFARSAELLQDFELYMIPNKKQVQQL